MSTETLVDPRYSVIYSGLNQLTNAELKRLAEYPEDLILLDGGNFDRGKYCPLAVALGIPQMNLKGITNEMCAKLIGELGGADFLYNQIKGTPGEFYRDNRLEDLKMVLNEVLLDRNLLKWVK